MPVPGICNKWLHAGARWCKHRASSQPGTCSGKARHCHACDEHEPRLLRGGEALTAEGFSSCIRALANTWALEVRRHLQQELFEPKSEAKVFFKETGKTEISGQILEPLGR